MCEISYPAYVEEIHRETINVTIITLKLTNDLSLWIKIKFT